MGIQGLLPCLNSIQRDVHISEYSSKAVAVDAYSWLHKGCYTCSTELIQGLPTDKHIQYCVKRVELLRSNGVIPIMVFDGGRLPMKKGTESERHNRREESRRKGMEFLRLGNRGAANKEFAKAVDVTPQYASDLIQVLKQIGVQCIVAPYEADAQLAYLMLEGIAFAVISEDSDLLPFGCKRVLYKLDPSGNGKEICLRDLGAVQGLNFSRFDHEMFLSTCILSGCDYLPSVAGLGFKKAYKLVNEYKNYKKALQMLRMDGNFLVPADYEKEFERALLTFKHQRVFDPRTRQLVHLQPLPEYLQADHVDTDFLGPHLDANVACGIADGDIDPFTFEAFSSSSSSSSSSHTLQRNSSSLSMSSATSSVSSSSASFLQTKLNLFRVSSDVSAVAQSDSQTLFEEDVASPHGTSNMNMVSRSSSVCSISSASLSQDRPLFVQRDTVTDVIQTGGTPASLKQFAAPRSKISEPNSASGFNSLKRKTFDDDVGGARPVESNLVFGKTANPFILHCEKTKAKLALKAKMAHKGLLKKSEHVIQSKFFGSSSHDEEDNSDEENENGSTSSVYHAFEPSYVHREHTSIITSSAERAFEMPDTATLGRLYNLSSFSSSPRREADETDMEAAEMQRPRSPAPAAVNDFFDRFRYSGRMTDSSNTPTITSSASKQSTKCSRTTPSSYAGKENQDPSSHHADHRSVKRTCYDSTRQPPLTDSNTLDSTVYHKKHVEAQVKPVARRSNLSGLPSFKSPFVNNDIKFGLPSLKFDDFKYSSSRTKEQSYTEDVGTDQDGIERFDAHSITRSTIMPPVQFGMFEYSPQRSRGDDSLENDSADELEESSPIHHREYDD